MIEIFLDDVEVPGLDSEFFVLWLEKVITDEEFICGDVNIIFVSDEILLDMNVQFLEHDYYTDIITFDYSSENVLSGELYISSDRVVDNAIALNEDYLRELKRVCVHGVLHLCGYKDKTDVDSEEMRKKEGYYIGGYVSRETT